MLASVLLWLWPRVCAVVKWMSSYARFCAFYGCGHVCVCAVVNWMSSYARFCASMVVATCVLSLT